MCRKGLSIVVVIVITTKSSQRWNWTEKNPFNSVIWLRLLFCEKWSCKTCVLCLHNLVFFVRCKHLTVLRIHALFEASKFPFNHQFLFPSEHSLKPLSFGLFNQNFHCHMRVVWISETKISKANPQSESSSSFSKDPPSQSFSNQTNKIH